MNAPQSSDLSAVANRPPMARPAQRQRRLHGRFPSVRVTILLLLALGGCSLVGPASIRHGRVHYNAAIQQTNSEQLLLNIVRLRYRDPPYFLEIAGVTSSFELRTGATGSLTDPRSSVEPNVFGAELALVERPTVSYVPLTGDKFASQLMTPIDFAHHRAALPRRLVAQTHFQGRRAGDERPAERAPRDGTDARPRAAS